MRVSSLVLAVQVADNSDSGCSSNAGDGAGVVFVSLLQNLMTGESGSSEDSDCLQSDGIIFTTD